MLFRSNLPTSVAAQQTRGRSPGAPMGKVAKAKSADWSKWRAGRAESRKTATSPVAASSKDPDPQSHSACLAARLAASDDCEHTEVDGEGVCERCGVCVNFCRHCGKRNVLPDVFCMKCRNYNKASVRPPNMPGMMPKAVAIGPKQPSEIGRASCRERV